MSDRNIIDHEGIIEQIEGDTAHVKIISESGCAACHAKAVCSAADRKVKYLDVHIAGATFHAGESVKVLITRNLGFRAVALGYVYPFILVMAVLIGFTLSGAPELRAGIYALCALVPYYLILFMTRKRITSTFTFSLKKT